MGPKMTVSEDPFVGIVLVTLLVKITSLAEAMSRISISGRWTGCRLLWKMRMCMSLGAWFNETLVNKTLVESRMESYEPWNHPARRSAGGGFY